MDELEAIYNPRTMLAALHQKPSPSTFLRDTFVNGTKIHTTKTIEIDIVKSGQTVAAYVARGGEANRVAQTGYETNIHVIPYVKEETRYTADDLDVRLPGVNVYGGTPKGILDTKMGEGLNIMRERVSNLLELQLARTLTTGKAVIQGDGVSYTIDFRMDPTHIYVNTGGELWTDTDADIMGQLSGMSLLPSDKGAPTPDVLVCGIEAGKSLLKNTEIRALLDLKNYRIGEIEMKNLRENSVTYLGRLIDIGLDVAVYTYNAKYTDDAGNSQPYMPVDQIVMGSTSARVTEHYGRLQNIKSGTFIGKEFPNFVVDPKGDYADQSLESSPVIAVHEIDAFVTRKVQ